MDLMTHTSAFLLPSVSPDLHYAVVVLNRNLPRFTPLMWNHEQRGCVCALTEVLIACTTRCLFGFPTKTPLMLGSGFSPYKPDVITGDLDSIRNEVMDFYSELGTIVIDEHKDQDTTDLHKCIAFIRSSSEDNTKLCILVVGALGGRFDHEIGNVNVLCRFPTLRIVLLSDDCLIRLLPCSHRHEIRIQPSVEGPHCGLIPVGTESLCTTTSGLRWNLEKMGMKFGGMLSTSNKVEGEMVKVESDADLLWTISIHHNI